MRPHRIDPHPTPADITPARGRRRSGRLAAVVERARATPAFLAARGMAMPVLFLGCMALGYAHASDPRLVAGSDSTPQVREVVQPPDVGAEASSSGDGAFDASAWTAAGEKLQVRHERVDGAWRAVAAGLYGAARR